MKYKLNADGSIMIGAGGHPIVIGDDNKEFEIDAIGAQGRITALNTESAGYRKRAQTAEASLKPFEGLDPKAATEAIATVATLGDDHKANMEKLRTELDTSYKTALADKDATIEGLNGNLYKLQVTNKFSTSPVVKKTILPPDIAATYFGKHFAADGTATDAAGNTIYSKENPGKPAGFDEALGVIIDQYPNKENILLSENHGGGGGQHQTGGEHQQELSSRDSIKAGLKSRT